MKTSLLPSSHIADLRQGLMQYQTVGHHFRAGEIELLVKQLRTIGEMCAELEEQNQILETGSEPRLVTVNGSTPRVAQVLIVNGRRVGNLASVIKALAHSWEAYEAAQGTRGERQAYLNLNLRLNALQAALKGA